MSVEFSREYFLDEVRDGFLMPGMTKKALAVCLNNYKSLEDICRSNGIHCSVAFGSMIGAVRSGGFIPWDDDIDVEMLREDYCRLKDLTGREENQSDHMLISFEESNILNLARQWMDGGAAVRRTELWNEYYGFPITTSVDIFLVDHIPEEPKAQDVFKRLLTATWQLAEQENRSRGVGDAIEDKDFRQTLSELERLTGADLHSCRPEFRMITLLSLYDRICEQMIDSGSTLLAEANKFLTYEHVAVPRRLYDDYIEMNFESETVWVPVGYEGILQRYYGNYMRTVLMGSAHTYPFYGEVEKKLKDQYGVEMLHYHFDPNEVVQVMEARNASVSLGEELGEIMSTLSEAHDFIRSAIDAGERTEGLFELIAQCQELAVYMGERIELMASDPSAFIPTLEGYCDSIFRVYQSVSQGEDTSDSLVETETYIERLETSGIRSIKKKKEIVFLCYKAEHWQFLHSLWEEVSSDEDNNVVVIPVPYYYKDFMGNVLRDEMQYEMDGYPEEVVLTAYDKYDLVQHHPDIVITTCPYDEYHIGMTVHPYYYTSNLRKYTEKLVLLSPFIIREVTPEDDRSVYSLRLFLESPGMFYADAIIAQSESMRQVYIDTLRKIVSPEENKDEKLNEILDWDKKIIGVGHPGWDWQLMKEEIEQKEKESKKTILYTITGSMLLEFGRKGLAKAKGALNLMRSYEGLTVLWYTDPYARQILRKRDRETWHAYEELIRELETDPSVIVERTFDEDRVVAACDMVYGNGCVAMNRCRQLGKPALLENPWVGIVEDDSYVRKNWSPEIQVAYEGEWSLKNFVEEGMVHVPIPPLGGNAKRIWSKLLVGER